MTKRGSLTLERFGKLPTFERFPASQLDKLRGALVDKGATKQAADIATATIAYASHMYVTAPTTKPIPGAALRKQLRDVAKSTKKLEQAMNRLSMAAAVELMASLELRPPHGQQDVHNPYVRAAMQRSARLHRLYGDLVEFRHASERATQVSVRRGPRTHDRANELFAEAICAWKGATNKWPTASKEDDVAKSPLPGILREMIWPASNDTVRNEALTDGRFLDVLREQKADPKQPEGGVLKRSRKGKP